MTEPSPNSPTVLLVDDEGPWLHGMSLALRRAGICNVLQCDDSRNVHRILSKKEINLILMDLTMPYLTGEELLKRVTEDFPEIPVIVLTGLNQVDTAVRCMKAGAFDYFVKSVERERIVAAIKRAHQMVELKTENERIKSSLIEPRVKNPAAFSELITQNEQMHAIFQYIEAIAQGSQPVLITGESGVGKELAARAVFKAGRPDGPFVALNAAGLDDNAFSDTLFGHVRGAFTGADRARRGMIDQAQGGTLFLDEIGDLSLMSQVKLLRLLQEGEYFPLGSDTPKTSNARIIFATNRDLARMQTEGNFRKDLYYRLKAHQVQLPALRERLADLPLLLNHFFEKASRELGKKIPTAPDELRVLLGTYHFPGNIRELSGMVYDAVSRHDSGKLSMDAFKQAIGHHPQDNSSLPAPQDSALLSFSDRLPTLNEASDLLVHEALRRSENNQTIASTLLGITRPALSKRLKKLREQTLLTP